uniref:DDB1- and CUL4-associated factor 13 n=1 Tax=Evadne anonyx TaxID=141404 RepID=A0A9N6WRP9_9CRUS|nr:EOG090X04WU [Evadne anonyx]
MKVKILSRNPGDYIRETKQDIHKVQRNYDPALHPFETPREYTRALNAVKLERVFAKPFVGCLDGHRDAVHCLSKHPSKLSWLYSGACDGELRLWDVSHRKLLQKVQAHDGFVRGITFSHEKNSFYTVGDDKLIKQWKAEDSNGKDIKNPINIIVAKTMLTGITHHQNKPYMATCGEVCSLWEQSRAQPIKTFEWGVDSLNCVKFNPVEDYLLGACSSDRSIILYDIRESTPLRKVICKMVNNAICWNPMEAFVFTVASEDYNLYTFDMRKLQYPLSIHKDHISAVLDVDYSPTGKELVSASYDKTIRIFEVDKGHSRDIYHTKRMQRLTSVLWSMDDRYIFSASDEMNIRIWKSRASDKLGVVKEREKMALRVNDKLKEKFLHHPAVKRIDRHRHVPKHVYNGRKELRSSQEALKRKESNRRAHSKPGSVPYVAEKSRTIIAERE